MDTEKILGWTIPLSFILAFLFTMIGIEGDTYPSLHLIWIFRYGFILAAILVVLGIAAMLAKASLIEKRGKIKNK